MIRAKVLINYWLISVSLILLIFNIENRTMFHFLVYHSKIPIDKAHDKHSIHVELSRIKWLLWRKKNCLQFSQSLDFVCLCASKQFYQEKFNCKNCHYYAFLCNICTTFSSTKRHKKTEILFLCIRPQNCIGDKRS